MSENTPLMKHAAALIARRAHSRGELRLKLAAAQKIEDAGEIEAVLDRLEHLNLLNDVEYAYNFAFHRIKDLGWGEEKVRKALLDRDIPNPATDRAFERVCEELAPDDGGDFFTDALIGYIEDYCRKHGAPSTLKDTQKMFRHLAGRGFDEDRIQDALRRVISPEIFRHFETGD